MLKLVLRASLKKSLKRQISLKDFVGNNLEWAKNKGLEMWGGLKQRATNIYNSVTSGISSAADTVKQGFNQGADWLKDKAGKAADTIGEAKTGLMNFFGIGNGGKGKTSKYGKGTSTLN